MGARNAIAAETAWSHLPPVPRLLLNHMALRSMDEANGHGPARRYFGGREAMAAALGYPDTEAGYRYVRAALSALRDAGAICQVSKSAPGRRAEYDVILPGTGDAQHPLSEATGDAQHPLYGGRSASSVAANGGRSASATGDVQHPQRGTLSIPPRNQEDKGWSTRTRADSSLRECGCGAVRRTGGTYAHARGCPWPPGEAGPMVDGPETVEDAQTALIAADLTEPPSDPEPKPEALARPRPGPGNHSAFTAVADRLRAKAAASS